jgi:hypothetical protein
MGLEGTADMSERVTERTRVIIVNISILILLVPGLIWCYSKGGCPRGMFLGFGVFLLTYANTIMYMKRRR